MNVRAFQVNDDWSNQPVQSTDWAAETSGTMQQAPAPQWGGSTNWNWCASSMATRCAPNPFDNIKVSILGKILLICILLFWWNKAEKDNGKKYIWYIICIKLLFIWGKSFLTFFSTLLRQYNVKKIKCYKFLMIKTGKGFWYAF